MTLLGRLKHRGVAALATAIPALGRRLAEGYEPLREDEIPWTPVTKTLAETTIALVTTAGVHHRDQEPFDVRDRDGDPSFRELDLSRPLDSLMITHDYYDHRDADRDINIVLPVERARELVARGELGGLADLAFGIMGHITGAHIETFKSESAPRIAARLRGARVDAVLLTPG